MIREERAPGSFRATPARAKTKPRPSDERRRGPANHLQGPRPAGPPLRDECAVRRLPVEGPSDPQARGASGPPRRRAGAGGQGVPGPVLQRRPTASAQSSKKTPPPQDREPSRDVAHRAIEAFRREDVPSGDRRDLGEKLDIPGEKLGERAEAAADD